ncbi:hypothetical protein TSAR_010807 [Trichomalopsis sarcophagae]|uniref:Secreted protein n=1 Tax=Trichomalopsis sarcophagae TaxID=543379 RepID=A0A232EUB4_9HYME|nr:hypothetical protein TSAR_010807 [Trichomalopsis sarcophagae]
MLTVQLFLSLRFFRVFLFDVRVLNDEEPSCSNGCQEENKIFRFISLPRNLKELIMQKQKKKNYLTPTNHQKNDIRKF